MVASRLIYAVLFVLAVIGRSSIATAKVAIITTPSPILIEEGQGRRYLNFDFIAHNDSTKPVALIEVKVTVRDDKGAVALERFIDHNGINIILEDDTLGKLAPDEWYAYFNPFHDFPVGMPLHRLDYSFRFKEEGGAEQLVPVSVRPVPYRQRAKLRLPLDGRLLSYDAHDFYSHHRRADLTSGFLKKVGITTNAARYGYDFSIIDENGRQFRGDGKKNEDWYSWEQPVYAPAGGTVVRAANDRLDQNVASPNFNLGGPPYDPTLINGNYVVVDHGNGEFSLLAHMRQGSVKVRVGDKVRAGEVLGLVGFSGAVITIHNHYQLQDGPDYNAEGLPSTFSDFERIRGSNVIRIRKGMIDTGEIVRSNGR